MHSRYTRYSRSSDAIMMPTRLETGLFRPSEGFYASTVDCPRRLPVVTFLPTGYEPNYPYPLIVFFHGQGGSEEQVVRLAPRLSRRNYICVGLRGLHQAADRHGTGYAWDMDGRADAYAEEYVFRAVEQAQETYRIHAGRIFLAGFCEGAGLAYRLGLTYPNKFGGVIALNGQLPQQRPLLSWPDARRLQVFIGHGIANATVPLSVAKRDWRMLYLAGLDVEFHTYPTTHRIHSAMLRDLNRWVMNIVTNRR